MHHPVQRLVGATRVTGSTFAPSPRYGLTRPSCGSSSTALHARRGLGVILDWVPAHFPRDEVSRSPRFDGHGPVRARGPAAAAPHPELGPASSSTTGPPRGAQLPDLETRCFWSGAEYPRRRNPRRLPVASMLYLDYSRQGGGVGPQSVRGARGPSTAVAFLKELNEVIYARGPPGSFFRGRGVGPRLRRLACSQTHVP